MHRRKYKRSCWNKGKRREVKMIIRIALPFRFLKDDLDIFCEYRMESERPMRSLSGEGKETVTEENLRFSRLIRIRFPDDREREEAEDLIRKAWRQYISLYYEGIPKRLLKLFFDVRIFDERTKHGYSENAVYFVRRQKPGRG